MNVESTLQNAGLTRSESKVYLSLLELGQSSITAIVKKSLVSTSKVYDILHRLEQKGLASHITAHGKKHFSAARPNRILDFLEQRKDEISSSIEDINEAIPRLTALLESKQSGERAEIYVGLQGLSTIFNQETQWMQKTRGTSYVIGVTRGGNTGPEIDSLFERLQQKRDHLHLKTNIVMNKKMKGKVKYLENSKFCSARYVDVGSEMTSLNVFGNKTVITVYAKQPFLFVITSNDVAKDMIAYFNILWKKANKA